MKQQDCIDTIGQVSRVPADLPALGELWLVWLASQLGPLPQWPLVWAERSRQRRGLGALDDRMLRDIGLSRSAAFAETQKWFWQP
jgi:uncharacterized protein YjiS (DUF1127 family)